MIHNSNNDFFRTQSCRSLFLLVAKIIGTQANDDAYIDKNGRYPELTTEKTGREEEEVEDDEHGKEQ